MYLCNSLCDSSGPGANRLWIMDHGTALSPTSSRLASHRRLWMLTWRHGQTPGYGDENGGGRQWTIQKTLVM